MSSVGQVNPFFTPTQISGCSLWWDAAEYSSFTPANPIRGTSIRGWRDKVSGITLSNYNSSPTWSSNGIVFTNSSHMISASTQNLDFTGTSGITLSQNTTAFIAHVPNLFDNYRAPFTMLAPGTFNTNPSFLIGFQNGSNEGNSAGTFNPNINNWITLQQASVVNTGARNKRIDTILSSASNFIWTNGTENIYSINNIGRGTSVAGTASLSKIGMSTSSNIQGNRAYDGVILEVLVYSINLSFSFIQQIEGYLAWKWGLQSSLPSNHPYRSSPIPPLLSPPTTLPVATFRIWQPSQISGLALWLDAADSSTITGSPVTSWTDKSGSGNTATSSTGPSTSTYNGYRVLAFNGTTNFMSSAHTVPRASHTLIAVHRPAVINGNTQGNTSLFRYQSGNYIVFPYMRLTTPRGYITNADGTGVGSIDFDNSALVENSVITSLNIITAVIQSGSQQIFKNGTLQSSDTEALSSGTSDSLTIGRWNGNGGSEYYQGDLAEMIVFTNPLTTFQRQQVEGYLAWKWGLQGQLPANHPFKKWPPSP